MEELKKDMFESTDEYQKRISRLERQQVGTAELKDYDADKEIFTIDIKIDNIIDDKSIIEYGSWQIAIDRKDAKVLYTKSKVYPITAKVVLLGTLLTIEQLMIEDYELIKTYSSFNDNEDSASPKFEDKIASGFVDPDQIENYKAWTDESTELTWEIKNNNNINKLYTFEEAKEYVKKLNYENYAGLSNWRLPTKEELQTLLKLSCPEMHYKEFSKWKKRNENLLVNMNFLKEPLCYNLIVEDCSGQSCCPQYWSGEKADTDSVYTLFSDMASFDETYIGDYCHLRCVHGTYVDLRIAYMELQGFE